MAHQDKKAEWIIVDGENVNTANLRPDILEQAQQKIEQCEQAVTAARANGDRHEEGSQLINLGQAFLNLGQVKRAIDCYEQALSIFSELGDPREEANCHTHLGVAYLPLKDWKNVHAHHLQAWIIFDKIGDRAGVARELRNLASLYTIIGQPNKAIELYQHALVISREIGDRDREANTLENLGAVVLELGQLKRALELFEQALALFQQVGNRVEETNMLVNLGTVTYLLGQLNRALNYLNQALAFCHETADRSKEALILKNIGQVYFTMKYFTKAIEVTQSAVKIYDEIGGPGADSAREQLEQFSTHKSKKTPYVIMIPIGLILALIVAIFSCINSGYSSSGAARTKTAASVILYKPPPDTGTITGMVLDKNGRPLVHNLTGEIGIVALLCTGDGLNVECLHKNYSDIDTSVLISSICDIYNTSKNCLLHWGLSAAKIMADGSYTISGIPPGQYDLVLIIINSGVGLKVQLKNVPPVRAGKVTTRDFVTQ